MSLRVLVGFGFLLGLSAAYLIRSVRAMAGVWGAEISLWLFPGEALLLAALPPITAPAMFLPALAHLVSSGLVGAFAVTAFHKRKHLFLLVMTAFAYEIGVLILCSLLETPVASYLYSLGLVAAQWGLFALTIQWGKNRRLAFLAPDLRERRGNRQ